MGAAILGLGIYTAAFALAGESNEDLKKCFNNPNIDSLIEKIMQLIDEQEEVAKRIGETLKT